MVSADNDSQSLPVIGWREWLSFPELGIPGLKAKIDTGARSSALHTHDYEIYEDPEGISRVRFHLHPLRGRADIELSCDAKVTGMREVKDSGGHIEHRPFITVAADLGGVVWPIEISLTNRESMRFRMLLGRTAIRGNFLIDTGRSYLLGKSLARQYPRRRRVEG
ncbi:MAG: ATP-dependent zinc protease [Verrucomicrobiae bacterium]|nr:ATP-dependent zinc protease [Verrucomicrobiae bacterium]